MEPVIEKASRYYVDMSNILHDVKDVDDARRRALRIAADSVIRSHPTAHDACLKEELRALFGRALECAPWDKHERQYALGMLHGAEAVLKGRASRQDSDMTGLYREMLANAADLLEAQNIAQIRQHVPYTVKIADRLEEA